TRERLLYARATSAAGSSVLVRRTNFPSSRASAPSAAGLILLALLVVDLNVAPDQSRGPVQVGRGHDAEFVRSPRLAAIVGVDGEGLGGRAGRPDDRGQAGERGVRHRAAGAGGDGQKVIRLDLDPYVHRMVVVLQVPCRRRARLDHEAEGGLGRRIG